MQTKRFNVIEFRGVKKKTEEETNFIAVEKQKLWKY